MNILSLFDGMSCGRIAAERAGLKVDKYYASEVDKHAIKVSQANWPEIVHLGDVTKWREWDIDWSSIDLLIGGSPCQGFSFAGKQLAFDDPRSKLFFVYVDILNHIKSVNPDVKFMLENVKMKKEHLAVISEMLGVTPVFINSALVSAQNRQRYYWCNWKVEQPEDKGILLVDILEHDVSSDYDHTQQALDYMNRVGSTGRVKWSFSYHSDTAKNKSSCVASNFLKGVPNNVLIVRPAAIVGRKIRDDGKRDDYSNLSIIQMLEVGDGDKSRCLSTVQKDTLYSDLEPGRYNASENTTRYRKFTPIECERLQTMPDNYTAGVSNTQRYRMIGNGWTVDVIAHIFRQM